MPTITGRDTSIDWGSTTGTLAMRRIKATRNVSIDLGTDFIDDTIHGSSTRSFAPTFPNFGMTITGLYDNTATANALAGSQVVIADAQSKALGYFSAYMGNISRYWVGSAYVSVDEMGTPYDDFTSFNWAIKPSGDVSFTQL